MEAKLVDLQPGSGALDLDGIKAILPHREPFLQIDQLLHHEPGVCVVGVRSVSSRDTCELPHYGPGEMLPPTLVLEAIAQTGAVLQLSLPENAGKNAYLVGIDKVRIGRPARPGELLRLEAATVRQRGNIGWMSGSATVDGELIVEGMYMFALNEDGTRPIAIHDTAA